MRTSAKWLLAAPAAVLAVGIGLAACGDRGASEPHRHGNENWEQEASYADMPSFLANYSDRTQYLYSIVGKYKHIMAQVNCYCGCMEYEDDPHDSLLRCYVAEENEDGVVWTDHSGQCGICTEELVSIEKWAKEGKSAEEIRQLIDDNFKPSV